MATSSRNGTLLTTGKCTSLGQGLRTTVRCDFVGLAADRLEHVTAAGRISSGGPHYHTLGDFATLDAAQSNLKSMLEVPIILNEVCH